MTIDNGSMNAAHYSESPADAKRRGAELRKALRSRNRKIGNWAEMSDRQFWSVLKIVGWAVDGDTGWTQPLSVPSIIRRGQKRWKKSWGEKSPHITTIRRQLDRLESLGVFKVEHNGGHQIGRQDSGNRYYVNVSLKVVHGHPENSGMTAPWTMHTEYSGNPGTHTNAVTDQPQSVVADTSVSANVSANVSAKVPLTCENSKYAVDYAELSSPPSSDRSSRNRTAMENAPAAPPACPECHMAEAGPAGIPCDRCSRIGSRSEVLRSVPGTGQRSEFTPDPEWWDGDLAPLVALMTDDMKREFGIPVSPEEARAAGEADQAYGVRADTGRDRGMA